MSDDARGELLALADRLAKLPEFSGPEHIKFAIDDEDYKGRVILVSTASRDLIIAALRAAPAPWSMAEALSSDGAAKVNAALAAPVPQCDAVNVDALTKTVRDEWGSVLCYRDPVNGTRDCGSRRGCRCKDIACAILSEHPLVSPPSEAGRDQLREALDHMHGARLSSIHAKTEVVRLREALEEIKRAYVEAPGWAAPTPSGELIWKMYSLARAALSHPDQGTVAVSSANRGGDA